MERQKGIYKRHDGRYEARYRDGVTPDGKAKYTSVYGNSYIEAAIKRDKAVKALKELSAVREAKSTELNLLILGAGSLGMRACEIARSLGVFEKIDFLDDNRTGEEIIGTCSGAPAFRELYTCAIVAIGDPKVRRHYSLMLTKEHFIVPKLISPMAGVADKSAVGVGSIILPQAVLKHAKVGEYCVIGTNAVVGNEASVGSFSTVETGARIYDGAALPAGMTVEAGGGFQ